MIYDTWLGRIWKEHMLKGEEPMATGKWMNDLMHWHLQKEYMAEFKIIDNLNQHPDGITFGEWMDRQGTTIAGIIEMKDVPLSLWMKLDVAPASAYSDAVAELEEIRDTHQEQIDKASAAVLEAESLNREARNSLLESTSLTVQALRRLEETTDMIDQLVELVKQADSYIEAWAPEDARLSWAENMASVIKETVGEPNDCGNCPFHKICPEADNRPVL